MKKYISLIIFVFILGQILTPVELIAQRGKATKTQSEQKDPSETNSGSSSGSIQTASVNRENLESFGIGPGNYRNFFVKLSSTLEGKRENKSGEGAEIFTNQDGVLVKKKKPNIKIGTDVLGQVTDWSTNGTGRWDDDTLTISFSHQSDKTPYVTVKFRFREWQGDEATSLCVDPKNREIDGSLFYLKIADGWFSFPPSAAETRLLFDYIEEKEEDPYEPTSRKPGESTGGKQESDGSKWSNKGMTIGDL